MSEPSMGISEPAAQATVLTLLRRQRQLKGGRAAVDALRGVAIIVLMVSVVALVVWLLLSLMAGLFDASVPISVVWVLIALVMVPALFWYERRVHGPYSGHGAAEGAGVAEVFAVEGDAHLSEFEQRAITYIELGLTGPRQILEAVGLRREAAAGDDDLERAADVAKLLFAEGQGMFFPKLLRPGDTMDDARAAVEILRGVDWADVSSDGKKVWMGSATRRWLATRAGDLPPIKTPLDTPRGTLRR